MMNKTADYQFTIVIPIFNEEDNISALEQALLHYLSHSLYRACALFVDDGSTDSSLLRIKEVCRQHKDFLYLAVQKNGGLSSALKAGIDCTESLYIGYMDADLQTAPEDFDMLLQYIKDYELVTGIRTNRKDSLFKKTQSKIANSFRRMMTHDGMTDTGCPLKVMHTDYAKRVPFFNGMHRFLPALFLLQGAKIKQIPVHHFPRTAGQSKYHLRNRLISPFIDCFAYRWMKKRYINYRLAESNLTK